MASRLRRAIATPSTPENASPPATTHRYLEDFKVGDRFSTGAVTLSQDDIIDFARRYDPQPFHLDPEQARASPYGGLIASGMQTIALSLRLFLDTGVLAACSLGSPGCEVQWKRPVRPGDTLRVVGEVVEVRPSASKPDRGILRLVYTTLNQRDETVVIMIGNQLVRRRPPDTSGLRPGVSSAEEPPRLDRSGTLLGNRQVDPTGPDAATTPRGDRPKES